jgi:predicted Zn-dependent peptidase
MPLKHTVKEVETTDGVKGLLIDVPGAPAFHYDIFFRGGYHATGTMPQQTAHVLEHIAADGTIDPRYSSKNDYLRDFYKNGAYSNASTFYSHVRYTGRNNLDEWRRALELRKLSLEKPRFTKETLQSEKGNAKSEMKRNVNSYARLAYELSMEAIGMQSFTSAHHVKAIDEISMSDITTYYDRTHSVANMKFIVAGDISQIEPEVVQFFTGWKLGNGAAIRPFLPNIEQGGTMAYQQTAGLTSVYFEFVMAVGRPLSFEEFCAFDLLNSYLFNLRNSKVLGEARERGIAYELHAYIDDWVRGCSSWHIWAPIAPENLSSVTKLIVSSLRDIIDSPLDEVEFAYAKSYSLGRTRQYGQTVSDLSDLYVSAYFLNGMTYSYTDIEATYENITPARIRQLAKEFVTSGHWSLAGVGSIDQSKFEDTYDLYDLLMKDIAS